MQNKFFIMSSSCKSVKGASRSLIIDYLRNELYFISNEYYDLLNQLKRNKVNKIIDLIEVNSVNSFMTFLEFLSKKEIGFLVDSLEQFPQISNKTYDIFPVKDAIIEIDYKSYNEMEFMSVVQQLETLCCSEIQIRLLSDYNDRFIISFLSIIKKSITSYLELHLTYHESIEKEKMFNLLKNYPMLGNVFIYNSPYAKVEDYNLETMDYHPTLIGKVYHLNYSFDSGNCCGIITNENLSFENVNQHNELKKNNGCLYKKVTIDKFGNIKNCPSINKVFGNIKNDSISKIIDTQEFKKLGKINKDEIDICKSCEFRYNCTDCRAFLSDTDNLYSKPLKCGYNPETCEWEDWSNNSLKEKEIIKIA
jgi:SPASM domain peptide maturase of grasp-with-spasm system